MHPKFTIGTEEWCCLPELNIAAIKARIDTGAKTSSIHASNIELFTRDSTNWCRFNVNPLQNSQRLVVHCEARVIARRTIRSSNGQTEKRHVIRTMLTLNDQIWPIEVTLANRKGMDFRMLIGREALAGRTLIDCDSHCLLGMPTARLTAVAGALSVTE